MGELEAAFDSFRADQGLVDAGGYKVGALTPLLARAAGLELGSAARGTLRGHPALIGHLRYGAGHAVGAASSDFFEFIVAITGIPESSAVVPRLFCRSHGRIESTGGMGMSLDAERVWTESVALTERYEVTTSPYQDPNWMLQLFSPDFIDWLVRVPPPGFAFELAYGDLVGSIPAGTVGAEDLQALWSCVGEVAERVRQECSEQVAT